MTIEQWIYDYNKSIELNNWYEKQKGKPLPNNLSNDIINSVKKWYGKDIKLNEFINIRNQWLEAIELKEIKIAPIITIDGIEYDVNKIIDNITFETWLDIEQVLIGKYSDCHKLYILFVLLIFGKEDIDNKINKYLYYPAEHLLTIGNFFFTRLMLLNQISNLFSESQTITQIKELTINGNHFTTRIPLWPPFINSQHLVLMNTNPFLKAMLKMYYIGCLYLSKLIDLSYKMNKQNNFLIKPLTNLLLKITKIKLDFHN